MIDRESRNNVISVLPLTVALWLGYLITLWLIDQLFFPQPVFSPLYYLVNVLVALAVLGLALWPWGRAPLGKAFLPLVIVSLSMVPVVLGQIVTRGLPPHQASGPEAVLLRIMPLLLIPLVLTAWQYGWRAVILSSGGVALLSLGLHLLLFHPGGPSLLPPVTVLVIQTVTFVVVGYFISTLISRLQKQSSSLAQANAQLIHYAGTLEELTISRERNRMARELHDTLAHTLSALSVQLETVKAYWEVDPAAAQPLLDRSLAATRAGLQETRRALKSLRASPLDDMGLSLALRQLATETAQRANLTLDLSVPEHLPSLSSAVEQCLYRVAQEAMTNVVHHANAHKLTVELGFNGEISLEVKDDGRGFDPQEAEAAGHFGLSGMRERAQLIGSDLRISSRLGEGTTIQLVISLAEFRET